MQPSNIVNFNEVLLKNEQAGRKCRRAHYTFWNLPIQDAELAAIVPFGPHAFACARARFERFEIVFT